MGATESFAHRASVVAANEFWWGIATTTTVCGKSVFEVIVGFVMVVEEIVKLHVAGFLASASRIALMMGDMSHLNESSKEVKEEFELAMEHFKDAFKAKCVRARASRILEDLAKQEKK